MGQECPKDRLEESQVGPRRCQGKTRDGFKGANLGQQGPKERPDGFKTTNLGQEGAKDRLDMVSREPIWAKKVPRID